MRITIDIDLETATHIASPHTFNDECEPACVVLRKIQKKINKRLGVNLK